MATKKSDEEILFPEVDVQGTVVKPLTLDQSIKVVPKFQSIINKIKKKGITIDKIDSQIFDVIQLILPELKEILPEVVDIKKQDIGSMPIVKITNIAVTIIQQNYDLLKNLKSLAPMMQTPNQE